MIDRTLDSSVCGMACPPEVLERVFRLLTPRDLCTCACVNWYWYLLSSQDQIWQPHVDHGSSTWTSVSNQRVDKPGDESSEFPQKRYYLRYRPDGHPPSPVVSQMYRRLMQFTRRYKFAFFGSGMEMTNSKRIARAILGTGDSANDLFVQTGIHPGRRGVGSGFCVRMADRYNLIACFFYSNARSIRETRQPGQPYSSLLFSGDSMTVIPNVREAFQEMDGLVYVVNAVKSQDCATMDKEDMLSLVNCAPPTTPLLVLSACGSPDQERIPATTMANHLLELDRTGRKWYLQDVLESDLSGLEEGLVWLIQHTSSLL